MTSQTEGTQPQSIQNVQHRLFTKIRERKQRRSRNKY
jgi:hypothetical protein